jgi:hypothetical protein
MAKKCVSTPRSADASDGGMGLASCYDVIATLEHQLRTARALLDALTERRSPETPAPMSVIVDYCAELRAEAVEVVNATETLQSDVCGPAHSMIKMGEQAEVTALLERIQGFWAQLPGTRPESKAHKALVDRIQTESAAYLKLADAARGVDRKADARADLPAG